MFSKILTVCLTFAPLVALQTEEPKNTKARDAVLKIAEGLQKGEKSETWKPHVATAVGAVKGIDEIMLLFRPRGRGGVGFGPPRGLDGIEYFLTQQAFLTPTKTVTDKLEKMSDDLVELGWRANAIGEVLAGVDVEKRFGKKADVWKKCVEGLQGPARTLAAEAKAKKSAEMLTALQKMHEACNACHYHFRQ